MVGRLCNNGGRAEAVLIYMFVVVFVRESNPKCERSSGRRVIVVLFMQVPVI